MDLVQYDSDGSGDDRETCKYTEPVTRESQVAPRLAKDFPPAKRRKALPGLPSAYTVQPGDDPSKHQGRTRSRPFMEGEYNAHLFLSLPVSSAFGRAMNDVLDAARPACPRYTLHSNVTALGETDTPHGQSQGRKERYLPLHVSLTHPLPLRRSQIDSFRLDIQQAVKRLELQPFRVSFAGHVTGYVNGRRSGGEGSGGRAFLALRTGAGTDQLGKLLRDAVHPILAKLHLPLYHDNPEFHASFAWCLLKPGGDAVCEKTAAAAVEETSITPDNTPFTQAVLSDLTSRFDSAILNAQPSGGWLIDGVQLKIAKDMYTIPFD